MHHPRQRVPGIETADPAAPLRPAPQIPRAVAFLLSSPPFTSGSHPLLTYAADVVAQSLRDLDLVFIKRLLLDYDQVFSAMGVPEYLWRRTGEIYKVNGEFSELVGVDG